MDTNNPFDKKLDLWKIHLPEEIRDAAIYVTDTLDLCLASAQSVFGENISHEMALEIYDRVVDRIQSKKSTDV